MTIMRMARPATALAVLLALTACAERPGVGGPAAEPSATAVPSSTADAPAEGWCSGSSTPAAS
ncbi:hypothetical protein [Blastococcus brunescens]|uniref:Uncharacterized protein n=1 Tax=Blastococcus brunescens TaxID=1564165 RepID=A0ABZ1AYG3_9ACTN|nr:hypothetical protein [Blastococcus sp. BMG 8361]WRL62688.1 hypothetical protein U6N30_22515 [Blastococcus sp. BMG 8361]